MGNGSDMSKQERNFYPTDWPADTEYQLAPVPSHPLDARVSSNELNAFNELFARQQALRQIMRDARALFAEQDTAIDAARCPTFRARLIQMENDAYAEWQAMMQRFMRRGSGVTEESFQVQSVRQTRRY
jgi:hypothetical protein